VIGRLKHIVLFNKETKRVNVAQRRLGVGSQGQNTQCNRILQYNSVMNCHSLLICV
jgi:hypothetical protein